MQKHPFNLTPGGPGLIRRLLSALPAGLKTQDSLLMYIGSRYGENVFATAGIFPGKIMAADEDAEALLFCKSQAGDFNGRVSFRSMSPLSLDPARESIDVVISDGLLSSYNKRKHLREARRVLKPGGALLLTTPVWLEAAAPTYVRDVWESREYSVLSVGELLELTAETGFTDTSIHDATEHLEPFYTQFTGDVRKIAGAGFEGFKQHKALVKHYKHEIDVYLKQGGRRWMGYFGVIGRKGE